MAARRITISRLIVYALEALLVLAIIALLLATWMPAIIGGNAPSH